MHFDTIDSDTIPDKRLALMLACAHPALDRSVHMPLMFNTVLGFTADQIARACAVPTATPAARLVRAKRRIKKARMPFRIPDRSALPDRMSAVLECVYGTYAIDWHSGAQLRDSLTSEALYLAEVLAKLAPDVAEAHGLAALICMTTARLDARFDDVGRLIPLAEQDVHRWNSELINRGAAYLRTAYARGMPGRFQLEAAIQAVHNARRVSGVTDWTTLRELHLTLHTTAPTIGGSPSTSAVTAASATPQQVWRSSTRSPARP